MKPLHIVVLLAAGAIGGAVIMRVALRPRAAEPAPLVAQVQTPPATAPATPAAEPADARATGVPTNPSPLEPAKPVRETPLPRRERHTAASRPKPQTVAAAANQPVATLAPAVAPPAPGPTEPPPQPVPPAH
jgi:hypothetical protein